MQPGEKVQIEAGDAHDRIVSVLLIGYKEITGCIPDENEIVVVGTLQRLEELWASREQRSILYVRIMFLSLC